MSPAGATFDDALDTENALRVTGTLKTVGACPGDSPGQHLAEQATAASGHGSRGDQIIGHHEFKLTTDQDATRKGSLHVDPLHDHLPGGCREAVETLEVLRVPDDPLDQPRDVDLRQEIRHCPDAMLRQEHDRVRRSVHIPKKSPLITGFNAARNRPLTRTQKEANKLLAAEQAACGHDFTHLKDCRTLTQAPSVRALCDHATADPARA